MRSARRVSMENALRPHLSAHHPADVIAALASAQAGGRRCVLVVVTQTLGGGVRAPGALMGVCEDGAFAGYVSNGCVDADVVAQAQAALEDGAARTIRYGEGSPFRDVRLPCGGAIELIVAPDPDAEGLARAARVLRARRPVVLSVSEDGDVAFKDGEAVVGWDGAVFRAPLTPRLRVRVAGRGAEAVALARLAGAAGYDVLVQSPDAATRAAAAEAGVGEVGVLTTPRALPPLSDDAWTAFALMFHDHDWEIGLLLQALDGEAFYIGALGGRRAQRARIEALRAEGRTPAETARVRGPIGLVPSLRDASSVAVSALAEMVAAFHERVSATAPETGAARSTAS